MSYPFVVQGDVISAVIDILTNQTPELAAMAGDTPRVSGDLRGYDSPMRWIAVHTYGGNTRYPKINKPRVDFEILAERGSVAREMGRIIEASMFRAMGYRSTTTGVSMSDVKTEMGLNEIPDKLSDSPRYVLSLRLTITPCSE